MTTTTIMTTALAALRGCQAQLKSAHVDAWAAVDHLAGACESRAIELMTKIEDALAHAQRLAFCVEGDHRADQARGLRRGPHRGVPEGPQVRGGAD